MMKIAAIPCVKIPLILKFINSLNIWKNKTGIYGSIKLYFYQLNRMELIFSDMGQPVVIWNFEFS